MFEFIIIAALSQSPYIAGVSNLYSAESVSAIEEPQLFSERDATPPDFVDIGTLKWLANDWKASIEAAAIQKGDTNGAWHWHESVITATPGNQDSDDANAPNVSHDAMLAKRWHWFQIYGVSQLHAVPREYREPWWFAY